MVIVAEVRQVFREVGEVITQADLQMIAKVT
jgi:hypothetical protein